MCASQFYVKRNIDISTCMLSVFFFNSAGLLKIDFSFSSYNVAFASRFNII